MLVLAGKQGVIHDSGHGKIWFARAPVHGIEQALLSHTIHMVDELQFSIVVSSIDTGKHVRTSRHYKGWAEDISDVHPYGKAPQAATLQNPHAVAMVQWYIDHHFKPGHENGRYDAVLFGPVGTRWNRTRADHADHAHVSIWGA